MAERDSWGITRRQLEVLQAVRRLTEHQGYPPSIRQLGNELGIASTNGVNDHLKPLQRGGFIDRDITTARSLRLAERGLARLGSEAPNRSLPKGDLSSAAKLAFDALIEAGAALKLFGHSSAKKVGEAREALRKAGVR